MDRDQRSRRQKSAANPPPKAQRRSMKSRMGLRKDPPRRQAGSGRPAGSASRPARAPASDRGAPTQEAPRPVHAPSRQPDRRGTQAPHPAPRKEPARPQRPPQNPQKPGYRPAGRTRPPRRVTQAEQLRRRRRRALLGMLVVFAVLVLGVVLSVNLLFKVTGFEVQNLDGSKPADTGVYTEEEILSLLDLQEGDNLFGFSTADKARTLLQSLPYLDEVQVHAQLPGTVVVRIKPATERFALETDNGWLVLSDGLKVLRSADAQPDGLILLEAKLAAGQVTTPGSFLELESLASAQTFTPESGAATAADVLAALMERLDAEGLLPGTTLISLTDMSELNFLYEGRVSVLVGTANNLDYKIRFAAAILLDAEGSGLSATDRGTLDVSQQDQSGNIRPTFNSAAAPTPTPVPTEAPPETEGDGAEGEDADPAATADPATTTE